MSTMNPRTRRLILAVYAVLVVIVLVLLAEYQII